jgi:hypothetical protein
MVSWKTAVADSQMHQNTQLFIYHGRPISRTHQWRTGGPLDHCPQTSPRYAESQPSSHHGRQLWLTVKCLKIQSCSFYHGRPISRMYEWKNRGARDHCPQASPRSGESQPSWRHGRQLWLIVRCMNTPDASFTMVGQSPECTSGRVAELAITVPEHLHDLRNTSLHGIMEDSCG